jgi:hypothetical protein
MEEDMAFKIEATPPKGWKPIKVKLEEGQTAKVKRATPKAIKEGSAEFDIIKVDMSSNADLGLVHGSIYIGNLQVADGEQFKVINKIENFINSLMGHDEEEVEEEE